MAKPKEVQNISDKIWFESLLDVIVEDKKNGGSVWKEYNPEEFRPFCDQEDLIEVFQGMEYEIPRDLAFGD